MRDLLRTTLVILWVSLAFPALASADEFVIWEHDGPSYCVGDEDCPEAPPVTKITVTGLTDPTKNGVHLIESARLEGSVCALNGRTLSPTEVDGRGVHYTHVLAKWFLSDGEVRPMRLHEYGNFVFVTNCFNLQPDQSLEIATLYPGES